MYSRYTNNQGVKLNFNKNYHYNAARRAKVVAKLAFIQHKLCVYGVGWYLLLTSLFAILPSSILNLGDERQAYAQAESSIVASPMRDDSAETSLEPSSTKGGGRAVGNFTDILISTEGPRDNARKLITHESLIDDKLEKANSEKVNSPRSANGGELVGLTPWSAADTEVKQGNNTVITAIAKQPQKITAGGLNKPQQSDAAKKQNEVFVDYIRKVAAQIQDQYVLPVSEKQLTEGALQGMLQNLDPHSMYLDEKSYNILRMANQGEFGGIGVDIMLDKGTIKVITPYDGSPAFKAGIRSGDLIVKVDDEEVGAKNIMDCLNKIRGNPGTVVKLGIYRNNSENFDISLVRDVVKIETVKANLIANDSVIYIKVNNFNKQTASNLRKEYLRLSKMVADPRKISGIILDLRWNPGGILEQAIAVSDMFLNQGDIVRINYRNSASNQVYKASKNDISNGLPIVVLINSGSASSAEIVAGALQDNARALLVGTRSFGKGSVQGIYPIANGGAIKLTTCLYYTPNNRSIQGKGIEPDIEVPEAAVVESYGLDKESYESSLKGFIQEAKVNDAEVKKPQGGGNSADSEQNRATIGVGSGVAGAGSERRPAGNSVSNNVTHYNYLKRIMGNFPQDFQLFTAVLALKYGRTFQRNIEKQLSEGLGYEGGARK